MKTTRYVKANAPYGIDPASDQARLHPNSVRFLHTACASVFAYLNPKVNNIFMTEDCLRIVRRYENANRRNVIFYDKKQQDVPPRAVLAIQLAAEYAATATDDEGKFCGLTTWKNDRFGNPSLNKTRFQFLVACFAESKCRPSTLFKVLCSMISEDQNPPMIVNCKGEHYKPFTLAFDLRGKKIATDSHNSIFKFTENDLFFFSVPHLLLQYFRASGHSGFGYLVQQNNIGRPYSYKRFNRDLEAITPFLPKDEDVFEKQITSYCFRKAGNTSDLNSGLALSQCKADLSHGPQSSETLTTYLNHREDVRGSNSRQEVQQIKRNDALADLCGLPDDMSLWTF